MEVDMVFPLPLVKGEEEILEGTLQVVAVAALPEVVGAEQPDA